LTKAETKFLIAKSSHAEEIKMLTDTHTEEKKRIAGQLFEMERQKLDLYTTNQSLSKENNELKEINANYESEISKMNELRAKDQKDNEELKQRIS
jgi:hypothetical protein